MSAYTFSMSAVRDLGQKRLDCGLARRGVFFLPMNITMKRIILAKFAAQIPTGPDEGH